MQPHSVEPTQASLATLPLSISRDENSTRSACIYHNCRFLVHLTHWNYGSAQVWAMSMDFVNPSRVKRFYQNEACQGDTICFPNHFFFPGGSSSKFHCTNHGVHFCRDEEGKTQEGWITWPSHACAPGHCTVPPSLWHL